MLTSCLTRLLLSCLSPACLVFHQQAVSSFRLLMLFKKKISMKVFQKQINMFLSETEKDSRAKPRCGDFRRVNWSAGLVLFLYIHTNLLLCS